MKQERLVLCARRDSLPKPWTGRRTAIRLDWNDVLPALESARPEFVSRAAAEKDASYKQVIPYLLVSGPGRTLACYPRQGAEARLHGLWSLGVGGHVDPPDEVRRHGRFLWRATLEQAARRELAEEFPGVAPPSEWECLGVINEEETDVGTVHFGVVLRVDWDGSGNPSPTEELHGLQWVGADDLRSGREPRRMEIWSELALSLIGA